MVEVTITSAIPTADQVEQAIEAAVRDVESVPKIRNYTRQTSRIVRRQYRSEVAQDLAEAIGEKLLQAATPTVN